MNQDAITIEIVCPVEDVFEFTVNPVNTPRWISSVAAERRSSGKVGIGTLYANRSHETPQETVYRVIGYEENRLFQLQRVDSQYLCTYTYEPIHDGAGTRLTYTEEVPVGEVLPYVLDPSTFEKLKELLEEANNH